MRTLVLGGARSGKSAYAEQLCPADAEVCYVATARPWPGDTDFVARIDEHRRRRPTQWKTEEQLDAVAAISAPRTQTMLVDDVGTWLSHMLDDAQAWDAPRGFTVPQVQGFVDAVAQFPADKDLVLVSPEVGLAVIPEHRAGRLFRDEIGALNAQLAAVCDRVVLVVAGLPMVLKN